MNPLEVPEPLDPREAASAVLQAMFSRDAAKALTEAKIVSDDLWAYGCNLNPKHCGILFLIEPQALEAIHGGQWTAVWRPPSKDGAFWGEEVFCQQCFMERGEVVNLRLKIEQSRERHLGMVLTMLPQWRSEYLHKMSKAELAAFLPTPPEKTDDRHTPQPSEPAQPVAAVPANQLERPRGGKPIRLAL